MESFWPIVLVGFVLLLTFPLLINFSFYVNALKNIGVLVFRFWGVPLISFKVTLSKQVITIIKNRGKEKQFSLDPLDPAVLFIRYIVKSLFALTIINYCKIYADVGINNNAFGASMVAGALYAIIESGFSILHTKKTCVKTFVDIVPSSNKSEAKVCGEIKIITMPIFVIYSLIRAKILTKRWFKIYERYSRI